VVVSFSSLVVVVFFFSGEVACVSEAEVGNDGIWEVVVIF
jgi:hypothetical protein